MIRYAAAAYLVLCFLLGVVLSLRKYPKSLQKR
jgi:hypothetical protein